MRLPALFILISSWAVAQSPQVPAKMTFAGMTLHIHEDARKEIQKDVDALTQYPKYFNYKVERAKTYFPIIEKIFAEERLPDDFKYLVLQESALIPDAVSTSNAVGFWQFKDFTAMEMGLRVDKEIDERMNIVSSTRAAAQYLKKNNFYFNNWLYALQAYQMGAGGVMRSVSDVESGASKMDITSKTYWYVKKYLAHKVAFESAVSGQPVITVVPYEIKEKKTLHEIAKEFSLPHEMMEEYNKWVRKGIIPDDRIYAVSIPVQGDARQIYAKLGKPMEESRPAAVAPRHHQKVEATATAASAVKADKKYIQGLPAIKAEAGETSGALASRAGISLNKFLAFNDLSISDPLQPGQYYFLKKKRSKAAIDRHMVSKQDETLWTVSQEYGIQLKHLKKSNPTLSSRKLKQGTVVLLPSGNRKPAEQALAVDVAELETGDFFSWSVEPQQQVVSTSITESLTLTSGTAVITNGVAERTDQVKTVQQTMTTDTQQYNTTAVARDVNAVKPTDNTPKEVVTAGPDQHVVVAGETLYALSKRYGVTVMDLVNWNQLSLQDGIKTGQILLVKDPEADKPETLPVKPAAVKEEFTIYEVKPSDTLYSVARQYNVTIKDLMDWNNKKDFNVSVGEKLRIHQK